MKETQLNRLCASIESWKPPVIEGPIPQGDMPGDKVAIDEGHISKSNLIFPLLVPMAAQAAKETGRVVVCVCGGSGVGKSETASLLSYYFRSAGVGAYVLSGDNYPRRVPMYNDAERTRVFRVGGVRGMLEQNVYSIEAGEKLRRLWAEETDPDPKQGQADPAIAVYQAAGRKALTGYLGTDAEQDFDELSGIIAKFRSGTDTLWLKRMGRTDDALWYDPVDMTGVEVLIIEWTHGNSDHLRGIDIPILLNSTPEETRAHRRSRNRDGKTDSAFTTMVLEIEQGLLDSCAHKARLIISKQGELLPYEEYRARMDAQGG